MTFAYALYRSRPARPNGVARHVLPRYWTSPPASLPDRFVTSGFPPLSHFTTFQMCARSTPLTRLAMVTASSPTASC